MSEDLIRYDVLTSEALRGIVRTVLQRVQKRGLPGEHHLYINFFTGAPGVILSKRLKAQYPEDMIIVLQYKFWDLFVYDDRFEVKLSFNNVPERLVVPFTAIKSFADPSVPYALNPNQFSSAADGEGTPSQMFDGDEGAAMLPGGAKDYEAFPASEGVASPSSVSDGDDAADRGEIKQDEMTEAKTAKVVELDLFRKK